jgi:hypothetical protein
MGFRLLVRALVLGHVEVLPPIGEVATVAAGAEPEVATAVLIIFGIADLPTDVADVEPLAVQHSTDEQNPGHALSPLTIPSFV